MKRLIASSSLALLLGTQAMAEQEGQKRPDRNRGERTSDFADRFFKQLDVNEDGNVDAEEFNANPRLENATPEQREVLFKRIDKNGDGLIQRHEMKPPKGHGRNERPNWLAEGPVSYEKFAKSPRVERLSEEMRRKLFDRMDKNGDGVLSAEDMPRRGRGEGDRRENGGRRPERPISHKDLDTDEDGKISFPEFQEAPFNRGLGEDEAEDRFEAHDKDGDGFLSPDEIATKPDRPERQGRRPKLEKKEPSPPKE
ncbi:EF-hand domain-containing protein [Roseibacillus persicicus]|uniref:EF-hand domain-containing protein n=1 Tax=Roseibacillus persicicus TaxID=454148 RepID=UPI0028105BFE|nr:EF-hand domain-containing protein [Roseibacillus persicicus]MDQ8191390.1 EF-hand domain-containing protein [Roseibacillus persicicus]